MYIKGHTYQQNRIPTEWEKNLHSDRDYIQNILRRTLTTQQQKYKQLNSKISFCKTLDTYFSIEDIKMAN